MARGKIQIKRIENSTNRQVTFSKRRKGLLKKADELTVLCDAKVSIIMLSSTGRLHEYISPSTTTKQFFDHYQKTLGVDIWISQYQKMQDNLKKLKDANRNLQTEIRQRMGECLNDLTFEDLHGLEQEMDNSVRLIREHKNKVISRQMDTCKKKIRNVEEIHRNLLHELDARDEDPHYAYGYDSVIGFQNGRSGRKDIKGDYDSVIRFQNGGSARKDIKGDYDSVTGFENGGPACNVFAFKMEANHLPNLHSGAVPDLIPFPLLE